MTQGRLLKVILEREKRKKRDMVMYEKKIIRNLNKANIGRAAIPIHDEEDGVKYGKLYKYGGDLTTNEFCNYIYSYDGIYPTIKNISLKHIEKCKNNKANQDRGKDTLKRMCEKRSYNREHRRRDRQGLMHTKPHHQRELREQMLNYNNYFRDDKYLRRG